MAMVRMRATDTMPAKLRQRYATRALSADGTFEVQGSDARMLNRAKWADVVTDEPSEPSKRRGRPPKARSEPPVLAQSESEPGDDLDEMLRDDLLAMAEQRGVELPSGYVTKDELIRLLRES